LSILNFCQKIAVSLCHCGIPVSIAATSQVVEIHGDPSAWLGHDREMPFFCQWGNGSEDDRDL
jgi:hypothetical protein